MNLSNKLILLRKAKGLSQDDLAVKLNISRQAVYKWETGQSTPDIDNLKILSTMYNVSVDNLLNDSEEITYKAEMKKLAYGKPVAFGVPSSDGAERDNMHLNKDDAKKVRIRNIVTRVSLGGLIFSLALFGVMLIFAALSVFIPTIESELTAAGILLGTCSICGIIIFLPIWLISNKFLYAKVYQKNTYFSEMKAQKERALQSKGYKFFALQYDLLQWFFYNPQDKTFGFYFDDKEQFVCPIQNYVSYTYPETESSEVRIGSQYRGSVVLGSWNGVGITRESKMAKLEQMIFDFTLKYCDETGELKEYKFSLSAIREYFGELCKDVEEITLNYNRVSYSTRNSYNEIVALLNFEKSKIA